MFVTKLRKLFTHSGKRNRKRPRTDYSWLSLELLEERAVPHGGFGGVIESALHDPSAVEITEYDVVTGQERVLSHQETLAALGDLHTLDQEAKTQGFGGLEAVLAEQFPTTSPGSGQTSPATVFGTDGRDRVTGTTSYPWSAIGQNVGIHSSTDWGWCSGAMIGPFHYLTAAHCVRKKSTEGGGFVSNLRVALGQDGNHWGSYTSSTALQSDNRRFGEANATYFRAYSWNNTIEGFDYDIALVTLDRRIGDNTGWFGYGYDDNNNRFLNVSLNSAGYPADRNSSGGTTFATHNLFHAFDPITSVTTHQLRSNQLDISGGNSGGPLWVYNSSTDSRTIYGVASYENASWNGWTRITSDKFNFIQNAIAEDNSARAPTDRPDLVDWDSWFDTDLAYFTPGTVTTGGGFTARAVVRNNGTASAGSFNVSFYASTNNVISTTDTLLGTVNVSSLGEFAWTDAILNTTLPNMSSGLYYVGWIIDSGGSQTEFLEGNNTGVITSSLLTVNNIEIDVRGNGISITDGDATPGAADNTDFGSSHVGTPVTHTFTIHNTGTSPLDLTGFPLVSITGSADFSITAQPTIDPILPGGSTTFQVRYNPSDVGGDTATISIASNDPDENPYTFTVAGNGTAPPVPEIDVQGNGIPIADGDATPGAADHTDFGNVEVNGGTVEREYTIRNTGTADLTLLTVTLTGANAADFTVTQQPAATTLAPGAATTFKIRFDPSGLGQRQATVSFGNNDGDENPFDFAIQGTGVDTIRPTVTINQAASQADPAAVAPIHFTVVFSEDVTGFTGADITLGGTAGATTAVVTGSGSTYSVAVSGMTVNGTVIVNIAEGVASDAAGNTSVTSTSTDNTVTLADTTRPTVTINQAAAQADPTNATTINFTVVFNEDVTGFTDADVTLGGTAGATTAVVTGSGTTYNVAVSGMTTSGTVIVNIAEGVAADPLGNTSEASTSTDNTVTFDNTRPTVTVNQASSQGDSTNTSPINFTVVFSEDVIGFTAEDVTLSGTAGATTAVVTGTGTTYNVAVTGMTADGTVVVNIAEGVAGDAAGNTNVISTSTDNTVTFDTTRPTVTVNQAGGQADPAAVAPIHFTVVFSEDVTGFTGADITLGGTAGATTAVVTGSGSTYSVAVSGMTVNGTVIVNIAEGVASDAAGNTSVTSTSTDNTVTLADTTRPTVTINQAAAQADPTNATTINFTVVFNEDVTGFTGADVTLGGTAGATTAVVTGSGTTYNVAVSGMTASGTVIASIAEGVASDGIGNTNEASTSTDNSVTFDNTRPTVTVNQANTQADPTNAATIHFTVVFSEAVTDFTNADVTLSGTAGATTVVVTGSGTTYNVAVSGMTTDGTVIATIAEGAAGDAAGNTSVASTSIDNSVTFDNTRPGVTVNQAGGQADPTDTAPINFTVVFSQAVTGFTDADVTLGGTAGATTAVVTGSGTTYNVAVSGMTTDGTVIITIAAGVATDAAGNTNVASTSTDNSVTFDARPPLTTGPIVGTEQDDVIRVTLGEEGFLEVSLNGVVINRVDPTAVPSLVIEGRGGNDDIEVAEDVPLPVSVLGGAGNDTLIGGAGSDTLLGGAGDDLMFGRAGDDQMFGEDGNDAMDGNDGNDSLGGGAGNDLMFGSAGTDLMFGEAGGDAMDGGADNDSLDGGEENDVVFGSAGNDLLFGSGGNDGMDAGLGDDSMDGGSGNDLMFGLDGNDVMYGLDGNDSMDGGFGNDSMDASFGDDLVFGNAGNDLIFGSSGNDAIDGNDGNDSIDAADGDDLIFGSGGNDLIFAGLGNDSVDGGPGVNSIDPGPGINLIFN